MPSLVESTPVPIGERVRGHLLRLGRSPAWLAERVGVPRSTITRMLKGERSPNAQTLQDVATALEVSLEELVRGTDAEERAVEFSKRDVSREHFDKAIEQMLRFERDMLDLRAKLRDSSEALDREKERRTAAERKCAALEERADGAESRARRLEQDVREARAALEFAVKDINRLKAEVETLAKTVDGGSRVAKVTAALAGIAAVASVAAYLARAASATDDPSQAKAAKKVETESR